MDRFLRDLRYDVRQFNQLHQTQLQIQGYEVEPAATRPQFMPMDMESVIIYMSAPEEHVQQAMDFTELVESENPHVSVSWTLE